MGVETALTAGVCNGLVTAGAVLGVPGDCDIGVHVGVLTVFAVVWWYKFDEDQEYFGKPVQVWKRDEYEPCGPALFMPVQRIAQRYASCSVTLNGHRKLIVSPVPRLFH